jgi:hypothetical protein
MLQSCDMGQTALLPFQRKACLGFFHLKNPTASAGFLPCTTCLHSASSVFAVHISCSITTVFVFRKPLFISKLYRIYVCYMNITLYITFSIICGFT